MTFSRSQHSYPEPRIAKTLRRSVLTVHSNYIHRVVSSYSEVLNQPSYTLAERSSKILFTSLSDQADCMPRSIARRKIS